jgi:hypothetical protein
LQVGYTNYSDNGDKRISKGDSKWEVRPSGSQGHFHSQRPRLLGQRGDPTEPSIP